MLVALDAGAEDIVRRGRHLAGHHRARPTCTPCAPRSRRPASPVESADLTMLPTTTVPLDDRRGRPRQVLRLIDALDDHDDVQAVYANFDIPDEILATVTV